MTVWIDPPRWPAHGRLWSHLVSDASLDELHAFARAAGIPARGFEGDHYDVPAELYAALQQAGATATDAKDLLRRLQASGLRLRKRRGERGVAKVRGVSFPDGSAADVELVRSARPAPEGEVFAAMVAVTDTESRYVAVHSPRRAEWSVPGGAVEPGESPTQAAVREVAEETGLSLTPADLEPCGYERFTPLTDHGRWPREGGFLQVYRVSLTSAGPPLAATMDDARDPEWLTWDQFADRCGDRFWWPLIAAAAAPPGG